jgi:hypothetical protein
MPQPQGQTAVYRLYDKANDVIYVSLSNNPHARWSAHASDKPWWEDVAMREAEWFATREEAEQREALLISGYRPKWNNAPGMPKRGAPDLTHKRIWKGWTPPQALLDLVARYEEEQRVVAATRDELEGEMISVMMTGVSAHRLSKFLPWRTPMIQAIGKRGGVPPLRPATVMSSRKA